MVATSQSASVDPGVEGLLNESLAMYQAGKYVECIAAARAAIKIKPDYAAAWNNVTAGYNQLYDWDDAIAAGEKAVALDPSNNQARANLDWAKNHKAMAARVQSK